MTQYYLQPKKSIYNWKILYSCYNNTIPLIPYEAKKRKMSYFEIDQPTSCLTSLDPFHIHKSERTTTTTWVNYLSGPKKIAPTLHDWRQLSINVIFNQLSIKHTIFLNISTISRSWITSVALASRHISLQSLSSLGIELFGCSLGLPACMASFYWFSLFMLVLTK